MKKILLLGLFVLSANLVFSQDSEQVIIDEFFEIFAKNSEKAINFIYNTNDWIDADGDAVTKLKIQLKQYEELIGEYYGEEFLYKGNLGESFTTYVYLVKYERQPVRFTFEFYRPKDVWMVYSFKFDDNFDEDFEDIIKYKYMNRQ